MRRLIKLGSTLSIVLVAGVGLTACGGATPEPVTPADEEEVMPEPAPPSEDVEDVEEEPEAREPRESAPEPEFSSGMSVEEAIAAVPQNAQRLNIEPDVLAAPLMKPELYEPCNVTGQQRFKLRVAVWDGRAVGVDVDTQPKNEKLASCLREQVESVTWPDKVKSLNTVDFSY